MSAFAILMMCVFAAAAAAAVLLPLLRGPRGAIGRRDHDLSVYRDQLDEIEHDLAAGLIAPAQAAAAKIEIERRVLKAAGSEVDSASGPTTNRPLPRSAAWSLAIMVPVAAVIGYAALGSPGMPDVPLASRPAPDPEQAAQREEFQRLTERLSERLKAGDGDLRGWIMLARSNRALGRTEESVEAFRRAVEISGGPADADPDLLEDFGEALFVASGGLVTPEARSAFEAALRQESRLFKARHYMAVAQAQSGEPVRALAIWRGMELDSPDGSPWLPELRGRIENLAAELGVAADDVEPERAIEVDTASAPPLSPAPSDEALSRADMEAAAEMSAEERGAFIRGMVERLARRLAQSPDDTEGWIRLSRAYTVLGEAEKAAGARRRAEVQLRERLDALDPASPERAPIEAQLKALDRQS